MAASTDCRRGREDGSARSSEREKGEKVTAYASRVSHQGSNIQTLDVEAFEVMQDGRADVGLTHSRLAIDEDSGSIDS
jgi:hypothetical protein